MQLSSFFASVVISLGCSDFATQTADGKYMMSARSFDYLSDMDIRIRGIKAGTTVSMLQVCPTCPIQFTKTLYDIVGATSVMNYDFAFFDGVNSQGLGVGALMDPTTIVPPNYNPAGPSKAIPFNFIAGYLLANFKTVAEVQAAIRPGLLQLTQTYVGSRRFPTFPLHLAIHDASGNSAVLELKNPWASPGAPVYSVMPNSLHALTNRPNLTTSNAAYASYIVNKTLIPNYALAYSASVQQYGDIAAQAYVNVPGDGSQISRRIRLALIRQFQQQGNWAPQVSWQFGTMPMSAETWSPNFGNNEWYNAFALTANGIMHNIQIQGYSGEGLKLNPNTNMNNPYNSSTVGLDQSMAVFIRDHTKRQYFWWTHRAQRWQSFKLSTMSQSFLGCFVPLPVVNSAFYDRTAELNNKATLGQAGVSVSATGEVSSAVCLRPICPATLAYGIRVRCECNGANAGRTVNGCAPLKTPEQVLAWIDAINSHTSIPAPQPSNVGSLTIKVVDCNGQNDQQCCNTFARAIARAETSLMMDAPVSCIKSNGGTLSPSMQ